MKGYMKFIPFKEWCYNRGYCSDEMFASINRDNHEGIETYQIAKQAFYKEMFKHSDEYSIFVGKQVKDEMVYHENDSLLYEALTYMLDEYAPISKH